MKKRWKVFWIVSGAIAGIGVLFLIVGLVMGASVSELRGRIPFWYRNCFIDFDSSEQSDRASVKVVDGELHSYSGISSLEIDVNSLEVNIVESAGSEIEVETEIADERINLKVWQEGKELNIETKGNIRINNGGIVNIYIPSGMTLGELSVSVGEGALYAERLSASEVDVAIGAGSADVEMIYAEQIDLECGIGAMDLTFAGTDTDYDYDLECGMGELEVGQQSFSGMAVDKTVHNGASKNADIEVGMGSVNISFEK